MVYVYVHLVDFLVNEFICRKIYMDPIKSNVNVASILPLPTSLRKA